MKILCREHQPGEVEQEITQRDQFNTDEVNLTATLMRESLQNSVDARGKTNKAAVRVRIAVREPDEANRAFFEDLFAGLKPHLEASNIAVDDVDFGLPRLLVIEDFGTSGLTGDFRNEDDLGPFNNFWRRIGRSEKGGAKGGRWGLGKLVFSSASRIQTFFGLTVREDEEPRQLLMGQAVLATRKVDGKRYAPHVFFAEPDSHGLQLPGDSPEITRRFAEAAGITRNKEPGLSIAIPFIRDELGIDALVPEVLKNYFFPILTGRLVVEIGNEVISDATFEDVAIRYKWQDAAAGAQMLEFIQQIRERATREPDVVLGSNWPTALESSLPGDVLEGLRGKAATTHDLLHVRAPVRLRHRRKGGLDTHIDLYLRRTTDQSRGGALYVRGEITVPDEARYFSPRQTLAAVVATDPHVVSFLGDAENPAHTRWNGNANKLRDWISPATRLSEIRHSLGRLQALLLQAVETVEKDVLKDIFSLADSSATPGTAPKPSDVRKPSIVPISVQKRLFSIAEAPGGFSVRSTSTVSEEQLPLSLEVTVAYDVLRGDPFTRFSPFDFDLTKPGLEVMASGASCNAVAPNRIAIECVAAPFSVTLSGLDPHRDVIVKVVKSQ